MQCDNILSEVEWTTVVKQKLGNCTKLKIIDVHTGPLSDKIIGFLGDHIRATLIILFNNTEELKLNFFVKKIPTQYQFQMEYVISSGAYDKEIGMYSTVLPRLKQHLSNAREEVKTSAVIGNGIKQDKVILWSPECLFTRPELIVLEDLSEKGFTLLDYRTIMDFDHCSCVLKALATMHAASFIVEKRESKQSGRIYKLNIEYPHILFENFIVQDTNNRVGLWFGTTIKALKCVLPYLPNYGRHSKYYEEVEEKFQATFEKLYKLVQPSDKYPNVISHGDLWANNIMFRYSDDKKGPEEVRFVDFQMVRYSPPAADIFKFLHATTNREFRRQNAEALLLVYYEQLSRELKRHGLDVLHIYPWIKFRESCTHYKTVGLIMGCAYHHFLNLPAQVIEENIRNPEGYNTFVCFDRDTQVVDSFLNVSDYRQRVGDDLEELIEKMIIGKYGQQQVP